MSNTYLKIDGVLPSGLGYLNVALLALPDSILSTGNIVSAFDFEKGLNDLVTTNTTAKVVGTPTATSEGYYLGDAGYIDTGLKETDEFTWIALVRASSGNAYTPIVTNWVQETVSPTSRTLGHNLAKASSNIKLTNAYNGILISNTNPASGNWQLVAMSKKTETGGYKVCVAQKIADTVLELKLSALGTASNNTNNNIFIGWTPYSGSTIPNATTMFSFAALLNKGLSQADLTTLMNNLTTELASRGITL